MYSCNCVRTLNVSLCYTDGYLYIHVVKPSPRQLVPSYNETYQRKLHLFGKRVSLTLTGSHGQVENIRERNWQKYWRLSSFGQPVVLMPSSYQNLIVYGWL